MNLSQVVAALYRAGVSYWATADGTLGYRAPNGLPAPLRAAMREHKPNLLALCAGGVTVHGKGQAPRPVSSRVLSVKTGRVSVQYLGETEYVDIGLAVDAQDGA